jgi:hypothetical protein
MVLEYGRGLAAAGHAVLAMRTLETRFGAMLDAGATAMWEMWTIIEERADGGTPGIASASHGWGAGILGFVATDIAGVRVHGESLAVSPCLDAYRTFTAGVHTRWGRVGVSWQHDGTRGRLRVDWPAGAPGRVRLQGEWRSSQTPEQATGGEWAVSRR